MTVHIDLDDYEVKECDKCAKFDKCYPFYAREVDLRNVLNAMRYRDLCFYNNKKFYKEE